MQNNSFWAGKLRPKRNIHKIVSVVPSQTELLYYFGLTEEVVGLTHFCVHPKEWHSSKTRVGGTKTLNVEKIKSLNPDLILANKEENVKEQIEALAKDFPVYVTDVNDVPSALKMMIDVGTIVQKEKEAKLLTEKISEDLKQLALINLKNKKVAYLIWKDPYMTIGGDTFISKMLAKANFQNVFADKKRYPEISVEDLKAKDLDVIFLSSEPYPFKEMHIDELTEQMPSFKIFLVDGELFSWYGSRMLQFANYVVHLHQILNNS